MVFFTCEGCGNAFKKNQVERHVMTRCGKYMTCIDCQKDFYGNEYVAHTKCISEEEKYNGPDWKPKSSQNKGERKQTAWVDTVSSVLENDKNKMNPKQIALLKAISKHDNVPRKKAKFLNFVRNIAKNNFDISTIEAVWDRIEAEWKRQAEANKPPAKANGTAETNGESGSGKENGSTAQNGIANEDGGEENENKKSKKSKKNKRKLDEEENENTELHSKKKKKKDKGDQLEEFATDNKAPDEEDTEPAGEFRWGEIIREILVSRDEKSIPLKKLKKKVFAEYYARMGDSKGLKTKEDLSSILNKKLKKKKFHINGDVVRLVEAE